MICPRSAVMAAKLITSVFGDVTKYFGVERDGSGHVQHYRGHRQDVAPVLDRVKRISQAQPGRFSRMGEHQYLGTIPRTMIDDWLNRQGKTWHDYATDDDLKRRFLLFMTAERPRFFMKSHQV